MKKFLLGKIDEGHNKLKDITFDMRFSIMRSCNNIKRYCMT